MREMHMVAWCDACQGRNKQTKVDPEDSQVTIDLGNGPRTVELCKPDRKALLAPLEKLLEDYGVPVPVASGNGKLGRLPSRRSEQDRVARPTDWVCPRCWARRTTRVLAIRHLATMHDMTEVEASKEIPPRHDSIPCPVCGFLAQIGTGITAHVKAAHGAEEWQRVKPELVAK